jgi:hypothetical protein
MTDFELLNTLATETLRLANGNIKRAAPKFAYALTENANRPLLIVLVADFLTRLPSSATTQSRAQAAAPPKPIGRRRQGKHRRTAAIGTPSVRAKAGAVAAMKLASAEIFNRKIRGVGRLGNIHVHELRAIAESQAATAASFLQRGYDDAVEAIACITLTQHCVAADPFAKVVDVIPEKVAIKAFNDAKIKAAEVIRDGSAKVAHDLIAAARGTPLVEGNETRQ